MSAFTLFVIACLACRIVTGEPVCSKFDFEEKTLQKLVRMEFNFEKVLEELNEVKKRVADNSKELQNERKTLEDARQNMQVMKFALYMRNIHLLLLLYCRIYINKKVYYFCEFYLKIQ